MWTKRLDNVPPLPGDRPIQRALELHCRRPAGDGRECRIGIAGPDGNIYRVVVASGFVEVAAVENILKGFGFIECPPVDDYRAVFHHSLASALCAGRHPAWSDFGQSRVVPPRAFEMAFVE